MPCMQVAVLSSVIVAILIVAGAALLWQAQLLRESRAREQAMQRQLTHASGFALAGQLGVAALQDVGRALADILVKTGTAQALVSPGEGTGNPLHAIVSDLRGEAQLTRDSVRRLLTLLEPADDGREPFDLHAMLAEAQHILAPEARRRGMEIILQPCPQAMVVTGARAHLQLVVLQLLANAMDAMENTALPHRRILLSTHDAGSNVEVQVSDRGHGFGSRRPETLFSPYYTTKEGRMGLGLSVARSIALAHEGRIEARRRAGGGAVFILAVPLRSRAFVPALADASPHSRSFATSTSCPV